MKKIAALGALATAAALLGLQILLGLEYTAGGTLGTQTSMIFAMVTLAVLPVFIEAARRYGLPLLAWALVVPFVAFLAYSLPATTGRTGEIKETKVAAAADVALWKAEITSLTKSLGWARPEQAEQCLGAPSPLPPNGWPKCRRATASVTAFTERLATLEGKVKDAGSSPGDLGSDLWAWATGADAATVRKVSVLAFAIGMDFAIWALIWLATAMLSAPMRSANDNRQTSFPVTEPLPPAKYLPPIDKTLPTLKGENVVDWSKRYFAKHGEWPKLNQIEAAFADQIEAGEFSRSTAYRRVKALKVA